MNALAFLNLIFLFNALNSACGLPFILVNPEDIIEPSFSITHPTEGFVPVEPKLIFACSKASFIK